MNILNELSYIPVIEEKHINKYIKYFDLCNISNKLGNFSNTITDIDLRHQLLDYGIEIDNMKISFYYMCYYIEEISKIKNKNSFYAHFNRNNAYIRLYNYNLYILHNSIYAIIDRSLITVCNRNSVEFSEKDDYKTIYKKIKEKLNKSKNIADINYISYLDTYKNSILEQIKSVYRNPYNHNFPRRLGKYKYENNQYILMEQPINLEESFADSISLLKEFDNYWNLFLEAIKISNQME